MDVRYIARYTMGKRMGNAKYAGSIFSKYMGNLW